MRRQSEALTQLRKSLLEMASLVEAQIAESIQSLVERNEALARRVLEREVQVNEREIQIEEEVVRFLALFHPEAEDLRTAIMILKINNDLERVGDHAENIAYASLDLLQYSPVKPLIDIPRMARIAQGMLHDALDAFVERNAARAEAVLSRDDEVDALRDQIVRELITYIAARPQVVEPALKLIQVAKDLERVGDLATNVAEDVVYMVEGRIVKHHRDEG